MDRPDVALLIPVYNEAEIIADNVKRLISFIERHDFTYEIVICSNGSTDGTDKIGRQLAIDYPKKVKFIALPERGVGLAFQEMVLAARAPYMISVDMDLSVDLEFIPECYALLKHNHIVVGSKKMGQQERQFYRTFISDAFILMVRVLLGLSFHDYSMAAKGYRRDDILGRVEARIDHGSSYVIELIYYAVKNRKHVIEVPVMCHDTRPSKFNIVNEIFYRFSNLIRLWLRERIM